MNEPLLQTERLRLRALTAADCAAVYRWCASPEVNRFMNYPLYHDPQDVAAWLATLAQNPGLVFGIVRKADGQLIGSCGICRQDSGAWDFGYNLLPECWGQGYATEAMRRVIDYVHTELGGRQFTAHHAVANPASGRVIQKCGLHPVRTGSYAKLDGSETFPAIFYEMTLD